MKRILTTFLLLALACRLAAAPAFQDGVTISGDILTFRTQKNVRSLAVYTIIGRQVLTQDNGRKEINIAGLPDGMYILKAVTDKGMSSYKFLKK